MNKFKFTLTLSDNCSYLLFVVVHLKVSTLRVSLILLFLWLIFGSYAFLPNFNFSNGKQKGIDNEHSLISSIKPYIPTSRLYSQQFVVRVCAFVYIIYAELLKVSLRIFFLFFFFVAVVVFVLKGFSLIDTL